MLLYKTFPFYQKKNQLQENFGTLNNNLLIIITGGNIIITMPKRLEISEIDFFSFLKKILGNRERDLPIILQKQVFH